MLVVGLTGGIASGKSTVAKLFADFGIGIVDADEVARQVVRRGTVAYSTIVNHFGNEVMDAQQELRRDWLRQRVVTNTAERIWLEELLHPLIHKEMQRQIALLTTPYALAVIPLLERSSAYFYLNRILVVDAPLAVRLARIQQRDQCSLEKAQQIVAVQKNREEYLVLADDTIDNTGNDLVILQKRVVELHQLYSNY